MQDRLFEPSFIDPTGIFSCFVRYRKEGSLIKILSVTDQAGHSVADIITDRLAWNAIYESCIRHDREGINAPA